jgi:coenzyme PQQ precursor peptide PqqA
VAVKVPACGKVGCVAPHPQNAKQRNMTISTIAIPCNRGLISLSRPVSSEILRFLLARQHKAGYHHPTFAARRTTQEIMTRGEMIMQWTAPAFEEVCLNCEINSYVSAKL